MEGRRKDPVLQRSDFSMELNRSFTLPVHLDHNEESEACKRDIVTVSPRECISDVEASMDSDFFSSLRNSISSNRSSIVNNENSAFTPVRKRERSVSLSPVPLPVSDKE